MPGNRSLDEFATEEDGEPPGRGRPPPEAADSATTAVDPAADDPSPGEADGDDSSPVDPMAPTFAWSGTGGRCGRCGEPAERRWRDGEVLVCEPCKEW